MRIQREPEAYCESAVSVAGHLDAWTTEINDVDERAGGRVMFHRVDGVHGGLRISGQLRDEIPLLPSPRKPIRCRDRRHCIQKNTSWLDAEIALHIPGACSGPQ